jgi:hypothetical protein
MSVNYHQKFTQYQADFLSTKFQTLFAPYPYIFVLQHSCITSAEWKKIKKALGVKLHKDVALHVVPHKMHSGILGLDGERRIQDSQSHLEFGAPVSFFGCFSPQDIEILLAILEENKLSKVALFPLGLFLVSKEKDSLGQFCNFLEVKQILSGCHPTLSTTQEEKSAQVRKSLYSNVLNAIHSNELVSSVQIPAVLCVSILEALQTKIQAESGSPKASL